MERRQTQAKLMRSPTARALRLYKPKIESRKGKTAYSRKRQKDYFDHDEKGDCRGNEAPNRSTVERNA